MDRGKIKETLITILKLDILQELFFSGIGCCFFIFLYNIFPENWHFLALSLHNYIPKLIISIMILTFFLVFILLNQPNSKINFFKVNYKRNIILFSIFNFATIYFLFFNTDFGLWGLVGNDNWFRTAYITKMANSGYPQDFIYKDLTAFYAPLYWYCLAIFARVFSIEPYKMLKYGFLFCYYILPILLYESWKKIYDMKMSFIITVLSLIIIQDSFYIDHIIAILFLIPYFMYYFENYTKKIFTIKNYIMAGFLGSIILSTFFLFFLILPVYYLILLFQNKNKFKEDLKRIFFILIFLIIFSSWFWFPLLINILTHGFEIHQNYFFNRTAIQATFFDDLMPISIFGIIFFTGLIFILFKFSTYPDLKILFNLLISVLIIFLIGFIGILIRLPIMHIRFIQLYMYLLVISAGIFYVRFFYFITQNSSIKKYKLKIISPHTEIYLFIFIIFSLSNIQLTNIYSNENYKLALDEEVPEDIIEIFEELDYEDKIFLTHHIEVLPFIPVYLFISPYVSLSHPSALHNQRIKFLDELSESKDSKSFYNKITDNEFDDIDYFWLANGTSSYFIFSVQYNKYEHDVSTVEDAEIHFKKELFENPSYFKKIVIEEEIIYKTIY